MIKAHDFLRAAE